MNDQFSEIQNELLETKQELVDRLSKAESNYEYSLGDMHNSVSNLYDHEKQSILHQHLREELNDVNRALLKMDLGLYGFCEETGREIPIDQLKVIPTARTMEEASVPNQFYKSSIANLYSFSY